MPDKIQPRTLKGFRDYLPAAMIPREWLVDTARRVYRSYGFSPIDTPALEYLEILTGKGSDETDKQLYRFADHGGRDVGLRFDLTVPLARFAAQHIQELGTPFKRYHIANVWRGENTQRGRYREFMQCDFDTIGTESISADIEMVLVVHDLFSAIGIEQFTIHGNNRRVLNGLLEKLGLVEQSTSVLRALDKLAKAGAEVVAQELATTAGASDSQVRDIMKLASLSGDNNQILAQLEPLLSGSETGERGLTELSEISNAIAAVGVPSERFRIDVGIARGLDYYTGTVLETFLDDLPGIGSVCSGGRYDNLAEVYTKEHLPGVGASLGLDRLLSALEELGTLEKTSTPAPVFLPFFDADRRNEYLRLAAQLRAAGIGVEFFPEPKKLGKQLQFADRRGFRVALIMGADEFAAGQCQVKDLSSGGSTTASTSDDAAAVIAEILQILKA
ncbi:histidine--tRNA ligase [Bythopirellula polymerisocia]|uniref:Histidine--tRNA ligase n=1 Tax=Bythopirellula polymerisocia TaxID=2528003 RepID=A0A5C6D2N3_9BACT|nr:histidine--tRNA ligase [Bythopirellula polymerisocia]TWU30114.1 Histidine--tRNA ligase [Bythopirellula polymerisocia]